MKKFTLIAVAFCIAVFLFCCKTYKDNVLPAEDEIVNNEISDYLNSAKGIMHNAPVAQPVTADPPVAMLKKKPRPLERHIYEIPTLPKNNPSVDEPVLTKKQERKALKAILKGKNDDEKKAGRFFLFIILYVVLGILIIVGLYFLIVSAVKSSTNNGNGCYVATMVYGSYDAPEVMVLRRFRDETLSRSIAGRAFIRWYYSWSPGFVAKYHHLSWLHAIIKVALNRLVKFLS